MNDQKPLSGLNLLLVSAFFESEMPSLREAQYARALAEGGANVTLFVSTGSNVWKYNRAGLKPTDPAKRDEQLSSEFGFTVVRRRPILRVSDLFVIWPPIRLIWSSDIVHVIEFRQGFTVLVAIIAKLFGKPVVYDHEQRGDRHYTIFHTIDSVVRRALIFIGSFFVDCVRHTVIANGQHFKTSTPRRPPMFMRPLGADEARFSFDADRRRTLRTELNVGPSEVLVAFTGKLTEDKRIVDVVKAAIAAETVLVLAGRLDSRIWNQIVSQGLSEKIRRMEWLPPDQLAGLYSASDVVVFTTFSLSYWEAALTGAKVVVPKSRFFDAVLAGEDNFVGFGSADMFSVEDEQYKAGIDLTEALTSAIREAAAAKGSPRKGSKMFSWSRRRTELVEFYESLRAGHRVNG